MQQYNKAIIALLAPALVAVGARYGLNLSADEAAILAALLTGIMVYLVPNKPAPQGTTYIPPVPTIHREEEENSEH